MTIWKNVLDALPSWLSHRVEKLGNEVGLTVAKHVDNALDKLEAQHTATKEAPPKGTEIERARDSLRALIDDPQIPSPVRKSLAKDFKDVQMMLDKLEQGHLHIAVFGRVSVGKSALLNALLGQQHFSTSILHGETREAQSAAWDTCDAGGVYLIDTPGINEVQGEERERLAHEVADRSDLILFVVDGDVTATEMNALRVLAGSGRPIVLILNKVDRYTKKDRELLLESIKARITGLLPPERLVTAAANPSEQIFIETDTEGNETEITRRPPPQIEALRLVIWNILESEGKILSAINATLFAGKLSDSMGRKIVEIKQGMARQLIQNYSLAKGVVVGMNPVPITDLVAATALDVSLVLNLASVYGLPVTRTEAGKLITTIAGQMALVMGSVWAVHLISSALKIGTAGISTVITAATQGAVAYYSTFVVGRAAQEYFAHGCSWGPNGPKRVVQDILDNVDRDSLLADAREQIMARLKMAK